MTEQTFVPPALVRDAQGEINMNALADVVQWFLDNDSRVNAVQHPAVEELFQWQQNAAVQADPEYYTFPHAEDRFAVGVMQALAENNDEQGLYGWLTDMLGALEGAKKTSAEIAEGYGLLTQQGASALAEAEKIPTQRGQQIFITACWLEALCTAEARLLGWIYQELYGRPFHPNNFAVE